VEEEEKQREEAAVTVSNEQRMLNCIRRQQWQPAMTIALELKQPRRLHSVLSQLMRQPDWEQQARSVLLSLSDPVMDALLVYIKDWNSNAKTALVANELLALLFRVFPISQLLKRRVLVENLPAMVSATP
jgi:U3 small nucleolar RNA-associated protein 13